MKIKLKQRIELGRMLDELVLNQTSDILVSFRRSCQKNQLDKSKPEDYRFVWQLFWALPPAPRRAWVYTVYAEGCNDDHIASVLLNWKRTRLIPLLCQLTEREFKDA